MRLPLLLLTMGLFSVVVGCGGEQAPKHGDIKALSEEFWSLKMAYSPLSATQEGVEGYDHLLGDLSREAREHYLGNVRNLKFRVAAMDASGLSDQDALNRQLLAAMLDNELLTHSEPHIYLAPLSLLNFGAHLQISMPKAAPQNESEYRAYINRLREFPRYFAQNNALLQKGIDTGWTQNCVAISGVHKSFAGAQVDNPNLSAYYTPFQRMPQRIPQEVQEELRADARNAILEAVNPAYVSTERFIRDNYYKHCRAEEGLSAIDGGRAFYDRLLEYVTTTQMSAEEIHQIGISEVERIRGEMQALKNRLAFEGSLEEFNEYMRSAPEFFASSREEMLHLASRKVIEIQGVLPRFFGKLPRIPVTVVPVPDNLAEKMAAAFLTPPSPDGSTPGYYNINLAHLDSQPKYTQTTLALHEAVPGHHLHLALQTEIDGPAFRKGLTYGMSAQSFTEGWALYCEYLGEEMGMYKDDYERYGRLSYEIWRAIRLVLDTGIHAFGWSRDNAIEYGLANSALGRQDIINEVDRFIVYPGQATAYKVGELTIRDIRRQAEAALGERFDIRAFHDQLLAEGALPLGILQERMSLWIERQTASTSS